MAGRPRRRGATGAGARRRAHELAPGEDLLASLARIEQTYKGEQRPADWLNVHKQVANRLLEPFMCTP